MSIYILENPAIAAYDRKTQSLIAGVTGILVLSGESTLQTLAESPDKPHVVLQDAGQLIPYLQKL